MLLNKNASLSNKQACRVIKSSQLSAKIGAYLVCISQLLCLAFLYGWRFLNKISLEWLLSLTTQPSTSKLWNRGFYIPVTIVYKSWFMQCKFNALGYFIQDVSFSVACRVRKHFWFYLLQWTSKVLVLFVQTSSLVVLGCRIKSKWLMVMDVKPKKPSLWWNSNNTIICIYSSSGHHMHKVLIICMRVYFVG